MSLRLKVQCRCQQNDWVADFVGSYIYGNARFTLVWPLFGLPRYSGTVGTGASGSDAHAERSMAMAAYAMTPVTTQRISVR
jgi:hypothetical protein